MQYTYKSVIESLSNHLQPPWMEELGLYGKVVHINRLFPQITRTNKIKHDLVT